MHASSSAPKQDRPRFSDKLNAASFEGLDEEMKPRVSQLWFAMNFPPLREADAGVK